jgi:hypothetical protein
MPESVHVKMGDASEVVVKKGDSGEVLTIERQLEKEKQERDSNRQTNVIENPDSNVVFLGGDFFDNMFSEYYQVQNPGYDALFSDERFPKFREQTVVVSRCYHYPVPMGTDPNCERKYLLFDIFEPVADGGPTETEIYYIKSHLNALGFLYTWVLKGEAVDIKTVFEKRLNMKTGPVKIKKLVQTNVETPVNQV